MTVVHSSPQQEQVRENIPPPLATEPFQTASTHDSCVQQTQNIMMYIWSLPVKTKSFSIGIFLGIGWVLGWLCHQLGPAFSFGLILGCIAMFGVFHSFRACDKLTILTDVLPTSVYFLCVALGCLFHIPFFASALLWSTVGLFGYGSLRYCLHLIGTFPVACAALLITFTWIVFAFPLIQPQSLMYLGYCMLMMCVWKRKFSARMATVLIAVSMIVVAVRPMSFVFVIFGTLACIKFTKRPSVCEPQQQQQQQQQQHGKVFNIPSFWRLQDKQPVPPVSQEYSQIREQMIHHSLSDTDSMRLRLFRLQDLSLWKRYQERKQRLELETPDVAVEEMWMFVPLMKANECNFDLSHGPLGPGVYAFDNVAVCQAVSREVMQEQTVATSQWRTVKRVLVCRALVQNVNQVNESTVDNAVFVDTFKQPICEMQDWNAYGSLGWDCNNIPVTIQNNGFLYLMHQPEHLFPAYIAEIAP